MRKKVALPHMGTLYIAWASLIEQAGGEVVIPPFTSKKTLSIGIKNSPEAMCLPYKLVLGNFVEAIENGANRVVMISSPGICRLGEYGKGIHKAIQEMGLKVEYIDIDMYKGKFKSMIDCLTKITGNKNPVKLAYLLYLALCKISSIDRLENVLSYQRAREINHGESKKVFDNALKKIYKAKNKKELKNIEYQIMKDIQKIEIDKNKEVLTVDITGEIYLVLDSFSNMDLEKELGKLGVQTRRSMTVSGWIKEAIIPNFIRKEETHLQRAFKFAAPYLKRDIGGDAIESISDVAYAKHLGKDGVIHLSPFTCMPEIMTQNMLGKMREDLEIPILPLVMDELTGKAGFVTRLEAFVDLMKRNKQKQKQLNF